MQVVRRELEVLHTPAQLRVRRERRRAVLGRAGQPRLGLARLLYYNRNDFHNLHV